MFKADYSAGNLKKYNSKNPIKRLLINRLHFKIIDAVKSFCNNQEPLFVLDAGCGEGFVSHSLNNAESKIKTLGVEYTSEALKIAKKIFPSYDFAQGDVTSLSYADDYFDVAVCSEVFEHLEHPKKALFELLRVCKKGVVVTVPHEPFFRLSNFFTLNHIFSLGNPEGHINHWTSRGFKKFIAESLSAQNMHLCNCIGGGQVKYFKSFPWIGCVIVKM